MQENLSVNDELEDFKLLMMERLEMASDSFYSRLPLLLASDSPEESEYF